MIKKELEDNLSGLQFIKVNKQRNIKKIVQAGEPGKGSFELVSKQSIKG